jgi:flagellar P-ring protein precursor FlgI
MKNLIKAAIAISVLFAVSQSMAARLKDISSIRGVRENQLIGYGIVVSLRRNKQ